jgi:hypothetical protein
VDCGRFFAPYDHFPSLTAMAVLDNTSYRLLPLPADTGASAPDISNVFLNTNGAFFNAGPNANGTVTVTMPNINGNPTQFTFADIGTFRGFILLHELGHQMGVYGADTDSAVNGRNSKAVLDNCFKPNAQGIYY